MIDGYNVKYCVYKLWAERTNKCLVNVNLLEVWMHFNFHHRAQNFSIILNLLIPIADSNEKFIRLMVSDTMCDSHHMTVGHQSSSAKRIKIPTFSMLDTVKINTKYKKYNYEMSKKIEAFPISTYISGDDF